MPAHLNPRYPCGPCILSILPNNCAGHYKKATAVALQLAISNCGWVFCRQPGICQILTDRAAASWRLSRIRQVRPRATVWMFTG